MKISACTLIGHPTGIVFSRLLKLSQKYGLLDRESYVAQYLALALFTIGITRTLGSDDLLAAFAAGTVPYVSNDVYPSHMLLRRFGD